MSGLRGGPPLALAWLDRRLVRYGLALLVAAAGTLPPLLGRVIPDTAFLLYTAERVLDGARLYVDIVEVNPPLIVWLNVPVIALARATGATPALVYQLAVAALALVSLTGSRWVLGRSMSSPDAPLKRLLLLALVVAVLPLARLDYGEREHLALMLALPFLLLTAARIEERDVPVVPALLAGIAAGAGIALKPHFLLAAAIREAIVASRAGTRYRPSAEVVAAGVVGVAYLGLVELLTPEYWVVVRDLAGPYHGFLRNSLLLTALLGNGTAIGLAGMLIAAVLLRHSRQRGLWIALMSATAGFWLSAVLQFKGWRYHFLPSMALGLVLLVLVWHDAARPLAPWTRRLFAAIAFGVAAVTVAGSITDSAHQAFTAGEPRWDADPDMLALASFVRARAAGRPVLVLSGNMASAWPLLTLAEATPVLRYTHPWPVIAAYQSQLHREARIELRSAAERPPLERTFVEQLKADLAARPPALIVELRPGPDRPPWGIRRLDWLAFMRGEPALATLLGGFELVAEIGQYRVYQRSADSPRPLRTGAVQSTGTDASGTPPDRLAVEGRSLAFAGVLLTLTLGMWWREEQLARSSNEI